jgi:lipoprotein signal peptidase
MGKKKLILVVVVTSFFLILLDQLTKSWADKSGMALINKGVSFGFLDGNATDFLLIILLIIFILAAGKIWKFLIKSAKIRKYFIFYLCLAVFFLSGALSNLLDRIWLGGVRDWLTLPFIGLKNNLADYYIGVSSILLFTGEVVKSVTAKKKSL